MNRQDYYEAIAERKNIWTADKKSNLYFQERIRYDRVLQLIKNKRSGRILDLGCGNGYLSFLMADAGNVVSLDLSKRRLNQFRQAAGKREFTNWLAM